MKFIKRNLKLFIGLLIGAVLAGGIVYAATTNANDVTYTTNKNGEVQTVADALNDLYSKKIGIDQTDANLYDSKICRGKNGGGSTSNLSFNNLEAGEYNLFICGGRADDAYRRESDTSLTNLNNVTFTESFTNYGDYISKFKLTSTGNGSFDISCFLYNDAYIYISWLTKI